MARIIGGLATSHAPQLLMPPLRWGELPTRTKGPFHPKLGLSAELTDAAKLEKAARCRAALAELRQQLEAWAPDAVIVVGDDQHENIQDDNMPPFVIYTRGDVDATLNFKYLGQSPRDQMKRYEVHAELAQALLEGLMDNGFDPAWSTKTREEVGLGHAFGRALDFLMAERRFPIVPVMVNTYYPPAPSAKRCLAFGAALRHVVESWDSNVRIVLLASGGLSHTVIDETLDAAFLDALVTFNPDYFVRLPAATLVEGTSEMRNWIIAAGVMARGAHIVDYVPCYRTERGVGCAMGFALWR